MIIAIDGESASGKGTLAKNIAKKLNYHYLDTGKIYRSLALIIKEKNISIEDEELIAKCCENINVNDFSNPSLATEEIAKLASQVAKIQRVRAELLEFQREFSKKTPGTVLDGRDIGTVVCPNANKKFYITASLEVRAERRHKELQAINPDINYSQVKEDLESRDKADKERKVSALKVAEDAIVIDTSSLTIEEAFNTVLKHII